MGLGDAIQAHRGRLRLSQAKLAERVGVRQATVSEWESGNAEPTAANLAALAATFEVSIAELQTANERDLMVTTQMTPGAGPLLPAWMELRITAFERECTRAGATDAQLDYIDGIMRSHATAKQVLFEDDRRPRDRGAQELQLQVAIDSMRFWLERSSSPGGAPIAPVVAVPEPGRQTVIDLRTKKK